MKVRLFTALIIMAIGLAGITMPAQAQAYTTAFTTSITYQNVGTADTTTLQILFYPTPTSTSPITITQPNLAMGAGTSVYIGNLNDIQAGFKGSAVMQADQPLLATLVQVPAAGSAVKVRPVSNGFSAGSPTSLIATVLHSYYGSNTIFSVQNVDSEANNINIKFYDTSATMVYEYNTTDPVESGAALYVDAGSATDPVGMHLPNPFNGSAVVTATRVGGGDGSIVSTALELDITNNGAKAFQGVPQGAMKFYMPSALCNYYNQNTSYAIQNTSLSSDTQVTVTYKNSANGNVSSQTQSIGPGAKASFIACNADQGTPMGSGFLGAATVTSTNTDVVAIGKTFGAGLSSAFEGVAEGGGSAKVALPYVRWATDANYAAGTSSLAQRVYITIQNIGSAKITGDVVVDYLGCDGAVLGTHTITSGVEVGAKVNSWAALTSPPLTEFGHCGNTPNFGGSALITAPAGSELAVVARVQQIDPNTNLTVAEDYDGLNVP